MKVKHIFSVLLLAALALPPAGTAAIDPFYQSLLRDGQAAFDRRDYAAAVRDLRLACFGMLEEPKVLADCLARLALAQDRADDLDGFRTTFQRLADIEERFKAYSQGNLPQELRASLEQRLAARLPASTLQANTAFRSAVAAPRSGASAPPAVTPPREQPAAVPRPEPSRPAQAPAHGSSAPVPGAARKATGTNGATMEASTGKTGAGAAEPSVESVIPPEARPLTEAERRKLIQARQLLAERRAAKELREAYQLAREVADAHPDLKEAQHLAAEGAYRISRWSDATAYFRRGGDPGENEPERLFYLAVSLFEQGDRAGAAAALRRSLPNLKRTTYVDSYVRKILGSEVESAGPKGRKPE